MSGPTLTDVLGWLMMGGAMAYLGGYFAQARRLWISQLAEARRSGKSEIPGGDDDV